MKTIYLTQKTIENISLSELDLEFQNKHGIDYEENETEIIEFPSEDRLESEGYPVEIDQLIQALEHLKSRGCNYVGLNDNGDHYGYDITGYEIYKSSPEEIQTQKVILDQYNRQAKEMKIAQLKKQIKDLEE